MPRVLIILVWLGISVYAIADWSRTSEDDMPGQLPRMMWLCILVATVPLLSLGSIAWILIRKISSAEKKRGLGGNIQGSAFPWSRPSTAPSGPVAPDDNASFLFDLQRDIQRRKRESKRESNRGTDDQHQDKTPGSPGTQDNSDGARSATGADSPEQPDASKSSSFQQDDEQQDHGDQLTDQ